MNDRHARLYKHLLQSGMDVHLGYKKNYPSGNISGNSRNDYPKIIQNLLGELEVV